MTTSKTKQNDRVYSHLGHCEKYDRVVCGRRPEVPGINSISFIRITTAFGFR
jgi:hypothetical protein